MSMVLCEPVFLVVFTGLTISTYLSIFDEIVVDLVVTGIECLTAAYKVWLNRNILCRLLARHGLCVPHSYSSL